MGTENGYTFHPQKIPPYDAFGMCNPFYIGPILPSGIMPYEKGCTRGGRGGGVPAGGGLVGEGPGGGKGSLAQLLGSNLPTCWDKNVLEVVLEKDDRGMFMVSQEDCACARLLAKLGIDQRPGVHLETVQICPTVTIQEPLKRHFQNTPYLSQSDNFSIFGGCPEFGNFQNFSF